MINRQKIVDLAYEDATVPQVIPFSTYGGLVAYQTQVQGLIDQYKPDDPNVLQVPIDMQEAGYVKDSGNYWSKNGTRLSLELPTPAWLKPMGPVLEKQVAALRDQYAALEKQQSQLQENERRLTERIAAFRIEKETIKATYTASQAQVRVNEAVAGLGSQMNDAGATLDRARDKVAQMQARAAATDEQAIKALQSKDFFKRYTEKTRAVAGGEVTVTPMEIIAETA